MKALSIIGFLLVSAAFGKYKTGSYESKNEWQFLDKFWTLEYTIYELKTQSLTLATYVDEFLSCPGNCSDCAACKIWSWEYTYSAKVECQEKFAHRDGVHTGASLLTTATGTSTNKTAHFGDWSRPHYWYLAVVNCDGASIGFKYALHWLQPSGSELSYDDFALPGAYVFFFVAYLLLFGANVYADFLLFKEKALHPIVRILSLTIISQLLGCMAAMIHWTVYAKNGVGVPFFVVVGEILLFLTSIGFMFLCILLAKGWSITVHILTDKKILLGILGVFSVLYIILFFWQLFGLNPATELTLYQSVPGGILLFVRCITALYFGWCIFTTLKEAPPEKKKFFYIFGICYGIWFLNLPIVAAVMTSVPPWKRDEVSVVVNLTITLLAQTGLVFLLWPSRAAKYFAISAPDLIGYRPTDSGYGTL